MPVNHRSNQRGNPYSPLISNLFGRTRLNPAVWNMHSGSGNTLVFLQTGLASGAEWPHWHSRTLRALGAKTEKTVTT